MKITIELLKEAIRKKGFIWYNDRPNDIGIRTTLQVPDAFNDFRCCVFPWEGKEELRIYACTTDPGVSMLNKPMNSKGCSLLVPGQYVDSYALGLHQGKTEHPALVQIKPVKVYRDNDRDNISEETSILEEGLFGINQHRANKNSLSIKVGDWSAGCQVGQIFAEHEQYLWIHEQFKKKTGNKFTYTLLKESDL